MSGSATFTVVMSSSSMKVPIATAVRVHHFLATVPPIASRPPCPDRDDAALAGVTSRRRLCGGGDVTVGRAISSL
jgi:hypothetical protein